MIFHISVDKIYYDNFYEYYSKSFEKFYPDCDLSLNFIGTESPKNIPSKYFTIENTSPDNIQNLGHYVVSRWRTLPEVGDHVLMSDVDTVCVKRLDFDKIEKLFKEYEVINLTWKHADGHEGGESGIIFRNDIVPDINNISKKVIKENDLRYNLDLDIRIEILKKYKRVLLPEVHQIKRSKSGLFYDNYDNRSFVVPPCINQNATIQYKREILEKVFNRIV